MAYDKPMLSGTGDNAGTLGIPTIVANAVGNANAIATFNAAVNANVIYEYNYVTSSK